MVDLDVYHIVEEIWIWIFILKNHIVEEYTLDTTAYVTLSCYHKDTRHVQVLKHDNN